MAFEEGEASLTCPDCNADHQARWSRMPVKELRTIRCNACGSEIFHGRTHRDYFEIRIVDCLDGGSATQRKPQKRTD